MTTENQEAIVAPVPAAPAAAAPAPTPAPADAGSADPAPYTYDEVPNDPGLNMALGFVGKLGITPDSPELQAALSGDFNFIKAKLASMGAKAQGFEHYIALAEKSYKESVDSGAAKVAATAEAIHRTVGSEENWVAIQAWASENADDGEKAELNAMLNAGGFHAKAAASYLSTLYSGAQGTVLTPADAAPGARSSAPAAGGAPMSPKEYQSAVAALVRTHGMAGAERHPDMAVLDQRRSNYRG